MNSLTILHKYERCKNELQTHGQHDVLLSYGNKNCQSFYKNDDHDKNKEKERRK